MLKKKFSVFIVGGAVNYAKMFENNGWKVTDSFEEADLVQFTGGEDVDPSFYGEQKLETTKSNLVRDRREMAIFEAAEIGGKALAGICRGGQFLNVMMGGTMHQHKDEHTGPHMARLRDYSEKYKMCEDNFKVSSTHHQIMIGGVGHSACLWSFGHSRPSRSDLEALTYSNGAVVCFQPHPEVMPGTPCETLYFRMIERAVKVCAE